MEHTHHLRHKRHTKIRTKVTGTALRPRLSVYRGLRHLYVQIIDDSQGQTVLGLSDKPLATPGVTGIGRAQALAQEVAKQAKAKGISVVVFDRGGFRYHGQIKAFAEALREAGISV